MLISIEGYTESRIRRLRTLRQAAENSIHSFEQVREIYRQLASEAIESLDLIRTEAAEQGK